jgi:hypothetical protein
MFYFTAILLYVFRVLLHPSSGVQETVVTATGMVMYPGAFEGLKGKNR